MDTQRTITRAVTDNRSTKLRSAVTNGRKLFVEGDGNSAWSRRYRDLVIGHVNDLGGQDNLSQSQLSLVRRASAIELELEQQEGRMSQGLPVDIEKFTRAASHLRRLFESLGLERKSRDVTPVRPLARYLRDIQSESDAVEEPADD